MAASKTGLTGRRSSKSPNLNSTSSKVPVKVQEEQLKQLRLRKELNNERKTGYSKPLDNITIIVL